MAYGDFRGYLDVLEAKGKLRRIQKRVDHTWEIACLARWMFQGLADTDRFCMLFEKVKGFDIPVVTGAIGASRETYSAVLQTEPDQINDKWIQALLFPISPQLVESAPCQEAIFVGDKIDLNNLPIPIWTPGKDAAPYVTGICIGKNYDSGIQNTAIYRAMVQDQNHLAVNLAPGRHGTLCYESYAKKEKPVPFAWVIGAEPAVYLSAVANVPYGVDEITIAGGLKKKIVEF